MVASLTKNPSQLTNDLHVFIETKTVSFHIDTQTQAVALYVGLLHT